MSGALTSEGVDLVPQGTAYGLLIGLGGLFCGVILVAVRIQKAYLAEDSATSEMFMVANRSVGPGLTASAVFSSWMWINETVLCAAMCYRYGVSVPMWWGSGLCFQIALMAGLGVMAKIRVPYAHTSLEIIKMRYGWVGHVVFIVLNITNNVFGCAGLILTGSQLVYGVSGMNFVAATILIPLGVVLYTAVGGLKATFLTDFLHTAVALVLIIYFTLAVLIHPAVGGLYGLWDKVQATAGGDNYIPTNYQGSLLTMKSQDGVIWGLIVKFGNLALVVMDTAFWQKSFASEIRATVPGYNLAALAIFAVPWGFGTVIGLTARVLHQTPIFPTYPNNITPDQVDSGMVMPLVVKALIGDSGMVAFFVLLFMAVTSTMSSSMIAVSSILSFDGYRTYINPRASDKRLVRVSHITVVLHAVFITGISIAMNYGGANMTWLNYLRPVISCPGIIPLGLTLFWDGQTKLAAILSPILGFLTGLGIWLGTAQSMYGAINLDTTMENLPALYGAIASTFSPALYSVIISLCKPYKFDWREFLRIELIEDPQLHVDSLNPTDCTGVEKDFHAGSNAIIGRTPLSESTDIKDTERGAGAHYEKTSVVRTLPTSPTQISLDNVHHPFDKKTLQELYWWNRVAWIFFVIVVLITFVVWPMPLYRNYIFTKPFFAGWTTVAIIWQFLAFFAVVIYPLYDGRFEIAKGVRGVWKAGRDLYK